jgi:hypothetical protein
MAELHKLNLASKPIRNRTIPFLLVGGLVFISFVVAAFVVSTSAEVADLDKLTDSEIKSFNKELDELNDKGENVQRQLSPLQRDLLVGAHKLVASKGFGWSRLFADLESMLPPRVSTSRIEVKKISKEQGRTIASLEIVVLSAEPNLVIQMLDRMGNSGIFRGDMRRQERREVDGKVLSEVTLDVVYFPSAAITDNPVSQ